MASNLFDELKINRSDDQEHMNELMAEIRRLLEAKKQRSFLERLRRIKPKTEPKAWD